MPIQTYDVIILGAGASGLMCGKTAAGRGRNVLILEHAEKAAKKLSITGGGKCNLTNREVTPADYAGENPHFCRSALARSQPQNILDWLAEAPVPVEERSHGQIFCVRSAKDLVNLLLADCRSLSCRIATGEKALAVEALPLLPQDPLPHGNHLDSALPLPRFQVCTQARVYEAHSVVIATGGPACPQVGATGNGYEFARAFGHRIVPIRPALAGLTLSPDSPLAGLSGLSLEVRIREALPEASTPATRTRKNASAGGRTFADRSLPLLFTHTGVSGPAALQASLHWKKGIALTIDFLPATSLEDLFHAPENGKTLTRNLLKKHLPSRLCEVLIPPHIADLRVAELTREHRNTLHSSIHAFSFTPSGTEGFAKAEVTAGGVSTEEISSRTMESTRAPGLFFCGEVLDVTGRLGGYNLHWAFASGKAAGEFV